MKKVDAHCHLATALCPVENLKQAIQLGVEFSLQGGIDPKDWSSQLDLFSKFPKNIGLCFGVHPYFVAHHSAKECESALEQLARFLPKAMALGEIGLDFRSKYTNENLIESNGAFRPQAAGTMMDLKDHQWNFFEAQLEMVKVHPKPIVLHLVRCFSEMQRYWSLNPIPDVPVMIHGFNGPKEHMKYYIKKGFYLSIGTAIRNSRLMESVQLMPLDRLLIESDSQTPQQVLEVAQQVASIRGVSFDEILQINRNNLERFLGVQF